MQSSIRLIEGCCRVGFAGEKLAAAISIFISSKSYMSLTARRPYNALLLLMATMRRYDSVEKVFEEMSLLGFSPMNVVCIELVAGFVKSRRVMDGVRMRETMRRFKFQLAYSTYMTLIGVLAEMHEAVGTKLNHSTMKPEICLYVILPPPTTANKYDTI